MNVLRQTIRNLILESACDNANAKIKNAIDYIERNGLYIEISDRLHFFTRDMNSEMGIQLIARDGFATETVGELFADKTYEGCYGAWVVANTSIDEGFRGTGIGALIYDVATELAGKNGITSDRGTVSNMAFPMYKYMQSNPQFYTIKPLDPETLQAGQWRGIYTSEPWDDCYSKSWFAHDEESRRKYDSGFPAVPDYESIPREVFISSPLNNVYVKKDRSLPTIKCLQEKGLLKVQ